MKPSPLNTPNWQTQYEILGFDRVNFVSDVMSAVPQNEHCRIARIAFEADGVRVTGRLTVEVTEPYVMARITRQLQVVRGVVQVTQTN